MTTDVLRLTVGTLAMLVAGASIVTAARYLWAAGRLGRTPGRILARHVAEVSLGTTGLVIGYAAAVVEQLGREVTLTAEPRLWLYLVSMLLLLIGVVEVGYYQRTRARTHPQRQEQVRRAVREAIDRQRVTGPRSADRVAVLAVNAVLGLEGTPLLPEPAEPPVRRAGPASATDYGRHALRQDRRPSP